MIGIGLNIGNARQGALLNPIPYGILDISGYDYLTSHQIDLFLIDHADRETTGQLIIITGHGYPTSLSANAQATLAAMGTQIIADNVTVITTEEEQYISEEDNTNNFIIEED